MDCMKAEELSMIKAHTFSATPTPAEATTPMELTTERTTIKEIFTRKLYSATGVPRLITLRSDAP